MITASRQHDADCLLALWRLIVHHQGDTAPLCRWLQAHPIQPLALAAALPLAARCWLANTSDSSLGLRVMATFANAMQQCDGGDSAAQIELAIAVYNWVLSELSSSTDPVDWATTLTNLATAYRHRRQGNPAANFERAIELYQQALRVASPSRPVALAGLAAAYRDRIDGDPADNLDCAIAAYEQALGVIPRHTLPVAWAAITNRLAAAYGDRQLDRLSAVDAAINTYHQGFIDLEPCAS